MLVGRVVLPETRVLQLPGIKCVPSVENLCHLLPLLGRGLAGIPLKVHVINQLVHLFLKPFRDLEQEKVDKGSTWGTLTEVTQSECPIPTLISRLPEGDVPHCGYTPGMHADVAWPGGLESFLSNSAW